MKKILIISFLTLVSCGNKKEVQQVAEISCGQCKFGMEEPMGCDLAIRFQNKVYFVEGAGIDDFGDAHDKTTGFCSVIRKANVVGAIEEEIFVASSIILVDDLEKSFLIHK
jgi:hypothetical protein